MGIEQLTKAASAAGYSMATQDDEPVAPAPDKAAAPALETRALTLVSRSDAVWYEQATGWLRSVIPQFGGRAPA